MFHYYGPNQTRKTIYILIKARRNKKKFQGTSAFLKNVGHHGWLTKKMENGSFGSYRLKQPEILNIDRNGLCEFPA